MKLKYYISANLIKALLISMLLFIFILQPSNGYTLSNSTVVPNKIFKCQPATIYANFSDFAAITDVWVFPNKTVMLNGSYVLGYNRIQMTNFGGGQYRVAFGNNASLIYGNKTLTFQVYEGATVSYNETTTYVVVFSDTCTGTGLTNYTALNGSFSNFGNYTSRLWTNPNYTLLDFAIQPWTDYWGYFFYLFIIGIVASSVYQKSQNIWQPILVAFTGLAALVGTTAVPPEFRNYIVLLLGIGFGAVVYRLTLGRR